MPNTTNKILEKRSAGNSKGQAALEFMVTYGWAIMAALVVVGALAYFGVFNTQRYVRDVCYFGDQLTCEDNTAIANGTVKFLLRNNLGADINVTSIIMKSDYGVTVCSVSPSVVNSGTLFEGTCQPASKLPTNSKFRYTSVITFSRLGSSNRHNQTGDVTATAKTLS